MKVSQQSSHQMLMKEEVTLMNYVKTQKKDTERGGNA